MKKKKKKKILKKIVAHQSVNQSINVFIAMQKDEVCSSFLVLRRYAEIKIPVC